MEGRRRLTVRFEEKLAAALVCLSTQTVYISGQTFGTTTNYALIGAFGRFRLEISEETLPLDQAYTSVPRTKQVAILL